MGIQRSTGIMVGMYNPGGGYTGSTSELDAVVQLAAVLLEERFGLDVEIRFNSDRRSGGAYLVFPGYAPGDWSMPSVGVYVGLSRDSEDLGIAANVRATKLRDQATANSGNPEHRYAWVPLDTVQDALEWIADNSTIASATH